MKAAQTIEELTRKNVETIARMERASEVGRTIGERVADLVAATVGSWPFIIAQSVILAIWVTLNLVGWVYQWDPYPFILLNLALSFQAAYASPIIMMSQNRQARLTERRNKLELQINLLAEQENTEMLRLLRLLCEKAGVRPGGLDKALEQPVEPERVVEQIESDACKAPNPTVSGESNHRAGS
jgi:uncharacterized membrane protein